MATDTAEPSEVSEPISEPIEHPDGELPDPAVFVRWPWRTGRKVGRTVYAHPPGARDGDRTYDGFLIGVFDSAELAEAAVRAHNMTVGRTGEKA